MSVTFEPFTTFPPGPNGGLTVPTEAYILIGELVTRDYTLRQEGDKLRITGPGGVKPELTASDIERITRWKTHLLALLNYRAPPMS